MIEKTRILVDELYSKLTEGQALEIFYDGSYAIKVGGQIYQALEIISDFIGSAFMLIYDDCSTPNVLQEIINCNIQRIKYQKGNKGYIDNTDNDIGRLLAYHMTEEDSDTYIRYI